MTDMIKYSRTSVMSLMLTEMKTRTGGFEKTQERAIARHDSSSTCAIISSVFVISLSPADALELAEVVAV